MGRKGSTPAASTTLLNLLSMSYEICGGPSPRSRRSLLALKVEAARQAACASLTSTFNQYVWISGAQSDDGCSRSQKTGRARLSLDDPRHQALPAGLRSGAENREVRSGAFRSDDGAIPELGSQSVVVDVRIPGGITHINRGGPPSRTLEGTVDRRNVPQFQ
jgi:hypothetical protein